MSIRVKNFYNNSPEREWNRLSKDSYHAIEFEITKRFISKYLSINSTVADIGGGPGRYTIWLLEKNNKVALVDLAGNLLAKAENEILQRSLKQNFLGCFEESATDLKRLESDLFDITLAFGPFYHLVNKNDRIQAMKELVRITRPGGYIFSASINRLCPIRDFMFGHTEAFITDLKEDYDEAIRMLKEGTYINSSENPNAFTDAYFAKTDEIPELYKMFNVDIIESFSCEGIASFLDEKTDLIYKDPIVWNRFLDLVEMTANEPSILGSGEHSVFIGRKKFQP